MPIAWVKFRTRADAERAIGRLTFAGFERDSIDRIQGGDGRWSIGVYVDEPDAPRIRALMCDPNAPTARDLLRSLLIFGTAALAGIVISYVLPKRLRGHDFIY
jgi:hypothetical protein